MSENSDQQSDKKEPVDQGTSAIEWIAAGLGGVIFLVMIGYMTVIGFAEVEGVPKVELTTEQPLKQGNSYHVGFTATNGGDATATGLVIRATLSQGDKEIESAETTIDYLPRQSSRGGGFYFTHDPAAYTLEVAPTTYQKP